MLAVIVFIVAYHKNFILTKTIQDLSFQGDSNEPNEFDSIQPIKPIRNRLVSKNGNKEIINRNLPIESDSPNMFRSLLMGFGYCFIGLALVIIGIGYIVWNRSHNDTTTEDYSEYSDPNHKRRNEKGNREKKKRKKKKRKDDTNDRESSNKSIFLWMSSDESDRNRNSNENNNKNGRRNERKRSSNHRRKKHDNKSEWDESETTFDEQSCPSSDTNENSSRQSATLSRRTMTRRANRKRYYSERARKNSRSEPSPDYTDCVNSSVTNTSTTTPSGTTIINTTIRHCRGQPIFQIPIRKVVKPKIQDQWTIMKDESQWFMCLILKQLRLTIGIQSETINCILNQLEEIIIITTTNTTDHDRPTTTFESETEIDITQFVLFVQSKPKPGFN
ncbi:hypothetical protein RDWZM_001702 [Blomia tropicalis]|uniref:Uncharacterized protein n=1 Tax=Blomia tropicalis TaxID=40697 RepID=A0A9Q0MF31_BLOTA|nr:hypothetical protein RDWZM_001702 [Blomia tropicalis]